MMPIFPPRTPPSTELPKPPVPYTHGWKFTAKAHTPPAPTLVVSRCCIDSDEGRSERKTLEPIDRCVKNPPLPVKDGHGTVSLEVIAGLKVGDGHNSQVFIAQVLESDSSASDNIIPCKGTKLVAKVYDPLYFDDDEAYINPFHCVDQHYTHEANTYMNLSMFQGHDIPRYYGSYTLSLPVPVVHPQSLPANSAQTRTVRMILVEYIPGITMANARARYYSKSARQSILKSIVDLESRIYEKDTLLVDLAPRNIIISPPDSGEQPRVVFVGIGNALFNLRRDDPIALRLNYFLGEYISPLLRWKGRRKGRIVDKWSEWIDWEWDSWLQAEFAHTAASITPAMRERWHDD